LNNTPSSICDRNDGTYFSLNPAGNADGGSIDCERIERLDVFGFTRLNLKGRWAC
jgi:hypothetical protein